MKNDVVVSLQRKISLSMNAKTASKDASQKKPLKPKRPSMSSGEKFLKRKTENYIEFPMVDRMHIVNAVALYLQSINAISNAKEITNIQFSDLFGASTKEYTALKVYTQGGAK